MKYRITFLFVLLTQLVWSQSDLSLSAAIQQALSGNYQIIINKKTAIIAQNNNSWLEAGLLPVLTANFSQNNSWNNQNNPTSFINGKFENHNTSGNLDANWVLFGGFKVSITKQKLAALQEQSEGNAAMVVENTIQSVILGYYNAKLQEKKLEVLEKLLQQSRDKMALAEEKEKLGSMSSIEVLQLQNALLTDSTNYLLQQLAVKNAYRNLNLLLGREVDVEMQLIDNLEIMPLTIDLASLKERTIANSQTLKNQFVNIALKQQDKKLARSALYPVLSVSTGYNRSVSSFSNEQYSTSGNTSFGYYANFSLRFTLFNGAKAYRAWQNAKISEDIARVSFEEQKATVINQLTSNYDLYQTRLLILKLTRENVIIAEKNLQVAKEKFDLGAINSFDFREVQKTYLNASLAHLEAIYNLIDTQTELLRISGALLEELPK
jgi:outer membrane protein TolC